ncbi:MAG TPA: hypothetical protein ENH23_02365, partial [candidate division Zixibacteria bacterium]|nr:hypothetical protein [candidate division Zixibacteria bacterium]
MKKIHALLLAVIVVTSFGCTPSFTLTEKNFQEYKFQVATADKGYSLEMPEVYDDLYRSNLLNLGGVLDTTLVRNYIDSLVFDSLIGFEADEINLSEYYYQYRLYKLRYYDLLLRQFLKKMVYDKAESDSLEIVDYYYANEKLFAIDEQINLYHILLTKNSLLNGPDSLKFRELNEEDLENAVVSLVDSVKSLITSPDKFPEIASQFSEDVGAKKGRGYVGWTKRGKYPDPFDSVAFTLRNGDIGGPYQDDNGWHIIMADEYYPAGLQPINNNLYIAAKNSLQTVKTNKIGNHLIDSLLADYDVVVNKDIADKNVYIVDGQTWGAIINGIDTIDCNEARSLE